MQRIPGSPGGGGETLGKEQQPPLWMKTQQVAVAWRKVAFVALRATVQLHRENKYPRRRKEGERDSGTAPSPVSSVRQWQES